MYGRILTSVVCTDLVRILLCRPPARLIAKYIFKGVKKKRDISRGGGGQKCLEHELTERISFSRPKKEKKKIPDDTKLILARFSEGSY